MSHILGIGMGPKTRLDNYRLLAECRAVEAAMADLYELLGDMHRDDEPMARLWRKTAREERNHVAQFTLAIEALMDSMSDSRLDLDIPPRLRHAIEETARR